MADLPVGPAVPNWEGVPRPPDDALAGRWCRLERTFRQAVVYKGRNRDTAWYSITDAEWPALRDVYVRWLDPANFDEGGTQRARLGDLIAASRATR